MSKYKTVKVWNKVFGNRETVFDYAGREMRKSACGDPHSAYHPTLDHIRPLSLGGTDARMPTMEREERKDTAPIEFTPYKPKIRKPGTGCVTMINDHLYEGRYTPTNAYGKRESHNIYAKTREECEEKLAGMIAEVKAQIKAEKEKMTG